MKRKNALMLCLIIIAIIVSVIIAVNSCPILKSENKEWLTLTVAQTLTELKKNYKTDFFKSLRPVDISEAMNYAFLQKHRRFILNKWSQNPEMGIEIIKVVQETDIINLLIDSGISIDLSTFEEEITLYKSIAEEKSRFSREDSFPVFVGVGIEWFENKKEIQALKKYNRYCKNAQDPEVFHQSIIVMADELLAWLKTFSDKSKE